MNIKNVIIKSINLNAKKALLYSHGGYTQRRGFIRKGSGMVLVPEGVSLYFNSEANRPSVGTKAHWHLQGYPMDPVEIKPPVSIINDYSLTHNISDNGIMPTNEYDIITISKNGKAHVSDVFMAIRLQNKRYEIIHSVACRINKLTYDF